ncbi:MAG: type VI secretion protein IcmF/TssM N-terminal domain-containing protein [Pirellulaceae bacterium]
MIALIKASFQKVLKIGLSIVAPVIAWRRAGDPWRRRQVIAIHSVAVIATLIGLSYLQVHFRLDAFIRSSLPLIRWIWFPLVATLLYAIAWTTWFIAQTLRMPADQVTSSEGRSAWREALHRFERSGIDVQRTPLYLVLGAPAGGIRDFFAAANTDLSVLPSAEEADEAIQFCGNRDAIYVCCRESSLTGNFTRRAAVTRIANQAGNTPGQSGPTSRQPAHYWSNPLHSLASEQSEAPEQQLAFSYSATSSNGPTNFADGPAQSGAMPSDFHTSSQTMVVSNRSAEGLAESAAQDTAAVQRIDQTLADIESLTQTDEQMAAHTSTVLQPRQAKQPTLRLEPTEATQLLDRLEGICREIAEARQPFCPINGLLVIVPIDATDCIETADHLGMRIQRDLSVIAKATETSVSAQVIFSDLELSAGGQAMLDRFPEAQRNRRLGAILPAVPSGEPDAVASGVEQAVRWICDDLLPPLGYRLMRRDVRDEAQDRLIQRGNHQIHRIVGQMRRRREGMSRLLRRAITATDGDVRVRGCFVAATGSAGATKQAFAEGIMPQILDIQNEVQWSAARRLRDRRQRLAAVAIYVCVAITASFTVAWMLQ